jgi:zinc protease
MSFVRFGWVLAAGLLAACSPVQEATLENGLKIIVKEDHRAPVVVSQIWYKVGASDEPEGLTGISHVLEHVMFKGTSQHKNGEFSRIIAENGGRENAFTGADYTAYFQQLEKSRLPIAFELEADRMRNLVLDDQEVTKEIRVVMEERRLRTDDQPESLAYERFMSTAYTTHTYKNPIIGWMRDLEKLSTADLRAWYQRWYVPNNATLVVVGDVNPREVIALARQHFGPVPARKLARTRVPAEPAQSETRRSRLSAPAQVPSLFMGFHAPALSLRADDWEPYALMVLNGVLDGGGSARFERELVRQQQIAASVGVGYSPTARHPVLFLVSATPSRGHTPAELEAAIRAQIQRVQEEPVAPAELERVKAQVAASNVFTRDSVFYQAMQMGMLETVGLDWRLLDRHVERLRAVTPAQVQAVAKKYLTESNLTVTVLDPQPGKAKPRASAPLGGGHGR